MGDGVYTATSSGKADCYAKSFANDRTACETVFAKFAGEGKYNLDGWKPMFLVRVAAGVMKWVPVRKWPDREPEDEEWFRRNKWLHDSMAENVQCEWTTALGESSTQPGRELIVFTERALRIAGLVWYKSH